MAVAGTVLRKRIVLIRTMTNRALPGGLKDILAPERVEMV